MGSIGNKRPKTLERQIRMEKLIRLTCDWIEGKYVLPNGKTTYPDQKLNKSELLRGADFPKTYKNAYMIFDKESFKAAIVTEQARRRDIDATLPDVRLDDEGDDELMTRLVNRELLYRLHYNPSSIETRDLLAVRGAVEKKKPPGKEVAIPGEPAGGTRFDVKQLVVMLDGRIPAEALAKLPPMEEVTDAEIVDDD